MKIEYSIVSRGTEKYIGHGYMAITEKNNNKRYVMNLDHGIKNSKLINDSLESKGKYNIENIIFSRMELIPAIALNGYKFSNRNVLILGLGNLGITSLIYLIENKCERITIYIRRKHRYDDKTIELIRNKYKININLIDNINDIKKYNMIVDTTGSVEIIDKLIESCANNTDIHILGTPREEKKSSPYLSICRKNIRIYGFHEFNGISKKMRQTTFNKLLKCNQKKNYLKYFIAYHDYTKINLKRILDEKNNYIDAFKY